MGISSKDIKSKSDDSPSRALFEGKRGLRSGEPYVTDKLDQIFNAQVKFRKQMGNGKDNILDLMDEQQKGETLYHLIVAVQSELIELLDTFYWKGWCKEAKDGDRFKFKNIENAKEEVVDIMCFLGDMCACVGLSVEDLAKFNVRKTEININRQKTDYAMSTKTGEDSKEFWNEMKEDKDESK